MRKILLAAFVLVVALAAPLAAQTPAGPTSVLGWDQPGTSLAEVNSFGVKIFVDSAAGVPLTGKTCTGTASPFLCQAALPALTVGQHTLRLSATFDVFESPVSTPLDIVMIVIQTPTNLRIISISPGK